MNFTSDIMGRFGFVLACLLLTAAGARGISWDDAGNSASKLWDDNGNWSPDGDPDGEPVFIGNLANAANDTTLLDRTYSIDSLTITSGADVVNSTDNGASDDFELVVNGHASVSGSGSTIVIYGGDPDGLDANTLAIGSGASVILNSTTPQGTAVLEVDGGTGPADLDVLTGGTLIGSGRIDLESPLATATTLMVNNGSTIANTTPVFVGLPPAAGTLQITATDVDARFDWDGGGAGELQANGNQTLDIDVSPGADAFSGTMNLGTGSTIDISNAWTLDSGTINANTPAFGLIIIGQDPNPGPAAHIAGASWTMSGGTINIDDKWDSLQFDSPFTSTGGAIANSGQVIFNTAATIGAGTAFSMLGADAKLTASDGATVAINDGDFNLDGSEGAGNVTTIGLGALLDINLTAAGADDSYGHTINLNGGELDVVNTGTAAPWVITANGEVNAGGGAVSTLDGDNLSVFGAINVQTGATLNVNTTDVLLESATINIAANGNFNINTIARFENSSFSITGAGIFDPGTFIIGVDGTDFADVVWNVAVVDLDDGGAKTINDGSSLTINADTIDPNDNVFNDSITIVDQGKLTVNLSGGAPFVWGTGTLTYNGDPSLDTFLGAGTSDLKFQAAMQVNGDGGIEPRVDFVGATVNINDVGERLRLSGGTLVAGNENTITNSTINGPGVLQLDNNTALRGSGVINAVIDDNGAAHLIAEGGTLTLGGSIVDIGTLGADGSVAILSVSSGWNTSAAINGIRLRGGTLAGALANNDGTAGIHGFGVVSAQVDNKTTVAAADGGTLTLLNQPPARLDGATDAGLLHALAGNLVVQYSFDTTVNFLGTVRVDSGREFFGDRTRWTFQPGASLDLNGGRFRSNRGTLIGGGVDVAAGPDSTVANPVLARFTSTSSTLLNGNLVLSGVAEIEAGAAFSGGGALKNASGTSLTLADGASLGVLLENDGTLKLGASPGQVSGTDFQQNAGGSLEVEIQDTGLNDFDRISLSGIAQLGGTLKLTRLGGFVPTLGATFTIVTAPSITGTFADVIQDPIPGGLEFDVVYNATSVQLVVVSADAYTEWINSFSTLTNAADQLKSADPDGDNLSNFGEFATDDNPTNPAPSGKYVGKVASVGGTAVFTLTCPMREGAVAAAGDPPGGELALEQTADGVGYAVQAADDLSGFSLDVSEVTGADAAAIQSTLPAVNTGWEYRSFQSPGPVAGDPSEFMRVVVSDLAP